MGIVFSVRGGLWIRCAAWLTAGLLGLGTLIGVSSVAQAATNVTGHSSYSVTVSALTPEHPSTEVTPAPLETPPPDPGVTPEVPPEETQSPLPETPSPTPEPETPTPTPTPDVGQPGDGDHGVVVEVEQSPPAFVNSNVTVATSVIAIAVLLASIALLVSLQARLRRRAMLAPAAQLPHDELPYPSVRETFLSMESVGEAMLDAGYSVGSVQTALDDIAAVNGHPSMEVVVLPTALFVSSREDGDVLTGAVDAGGGDLHFHQVDALDKIAGKARTGELPPAAVREAIAAMRALPVPFSKPIRVLAYSAVCASLAALLGASWFGLAFSAGLGALVGATLLLSARFPRQYEPLFTVGLAFGVSIAVFLVTRSGWDPGVLPSLIAPLVLLLPGGLLTTGVIELASGQMLSGAGRFAAGSIRLLLLAIGFVAGAQLVGVPKIELTEAYAQLGSAAPWIAVAVFGVGIVINQGGRLNSIPWILLVLYVAYGAQVIGSIFFGGVISAMIGALAMTPVAYLVSRHPSGPAEMVSFLPAFWLLVPGALGLLGVTDLLSGENVGANTLITTIATMVAIVLGILIGSVSSTGIRASRRTQLLSQDVRA